MENFKFRFGALIILASFCCVINAVPTLSPIPNLRACNLPPITGPCIAAFRRYHFNIVTGQCRVFSYGGCQGNANNFETLEECQMFGRMCLQRKEAPLPTRKPMSDHPPLDLQWVGKHPITAGSIGLPGAGWS